MSPNTRLTFMRRHWQEPRMVSAVLSGMLAISITVTGCAHENNPKDQSARSTQKSQTSQVDVATIRLKTEAEIPTDGSPLSFVDSDDIWSAQDIDASYNDEAATHITLDGTTANVSGSNEGSVKLSGCELTISEGGTYVVSGQATDMTLVANAPDEAVVRLVLDGVSVTRNGYASLFAKESGKVIVTTVAGTENSIASVGEFAGYDDSVDGAIFSQCDLTINGSGKLSVSSDSGNGIVCKDDLLLMSSDATVSTNGHAIKANDSIAVRDGTWKLVGGKDSIHAKNSDDQSKGWIYVAGGNLELEAGTDGMDSGSWLQIDSGNVVVNAGDDAIHAELDLAVNGGAIDIQSCQEGIEGGTVTLTAGDVTIASKDDGINATGQSDDVSEDQQNEAPIGETGPTGASETERPSEPVVSQDEMKVEDSATATNVTMERPPMGNGQESPDGTRSSMEPRDGHDSPAMLGIVSDSDMRPPQLPQDETEGQDGSTMRDDHVPDASISDFSPQFTKNAPPQDGLRGRGMDANETAILTISGGKLMIDSLGDGIDSNGSIRFFGGETCVFGPNDNGNTALDYGTSMLTNGGTVIAVGSSGMAESPSQQSMQASMTVFLDSKTTGDVSITRDGTSVISCSPTREYTAVIASFPELSVDGEYGLATGQKSQVLKMDGLVTIFGTNSFGFDAGNGSPEGVPRPHDGFARPSDLVGQKIGTESGN